MNASAILVAIQPLANLAHAVMKAHHALRLSLQYTHSHPTAKEKLESYINGNEFISPLHTSQTKLTPCCRARKSLVQSSWFPRNLCSSDIFRLHSEIALRGRSKASRYPRSHCQGGTVHQEPSPKIGARRSNRNLCSSQRSPGPHNRLVSCHLPREPRSWF